jgi:hypothetical protein
VSESIEYKTGPVSKAAFCQSTTPHQHLGYRKLDRMMAVQPAQLNAHQENIF